MVAQNSLNILEPLSFHGVAATVCVNYYANAKIVTTKIISGMLLCCEEKANQMQDEETES